MCIFIYSGVFCEEDEAGAFNLLSRSVMNI